MDRKWKSPFELSGSGFLGVILDVLRQFLTMSYKRVSVLL
jgi:hypothetical protein